MTVLLMFALISADPEIPLDFTCLARPVPPSNFIEQFDHPENPVDILHYDIELDVLETEFEVEGNTEITLTPSAGPVDSIRLDLRQLTVDSIWNETGPLSFFQEQDSIFITLGETLSPGDTSTVSIDYSGTPYHESWGGFWFTGTTIFHIGVGIYTEGQCMGKCMFPCWDHQNDKATFDFHITCDDESYAVANGDSAGVDYAGGRATYHWSIDQNMPTYLVAFNIADFAVLHDSTDSRIFYYVFSWDVDDALASFVNVDHMMANLENLFGPYPWDCRFSLVQTPKGDMEHVSHVSHVSFAVNGQTNYDWLIAHEMTHHWWGCCVTPAEWQHIWLKEGFATLGEALWMETYGPDQYTEYMIDNIMLPYLNSGETFPISSPQTPAEIFSATTYDKAGAVLHMLRYVMGDTDFFAALNQFFDDNMYGTVWADDLRDAIEAYTGDDIDWFFDSWIHGYGYPVYDINYSWEEVSGQWELTVDVSQTQSTPTIFEMPLEFLVEGASGDTLLVMWNDMQSQSQVYQIPFEPLNVVFDPYTHILCGNILTGIEDFHLPEGGVSTAYLAPNPAANSTTVIWPGTGDYGLTVEIFDLSGRRVYRQSLLSGERSVQLPEDLPSATYLMQITTETGIRQTARMVIIH